MFSWQRYVYDVPPGFEGQPILMMLTIFSLLMITLLSLEWMWRIAWGAHENPYPVQHPITVLRFILFCVAFQIVLRIGPDVIRFSMFKDLSPAWRHHLYTLDHILDVLSFFPLSLAWLVAFLTMDMLHYQLDKKPVPLHLWPTSRQLRRPLKIGAAVFAISAAIVYLG